jgi:hypothetical protein
MTFWKYFFQKLTEFTLGNNVLDAPASNRDGFVWRDTCVPSNKQNRPIWRNRAYLHLDTPNLQELFLEKLTQFSLDNSVLNAPASNSDGFLKKYMCSFNLSEKPIWRKQRLSPS